MLVLFLFLKLFLLAFLAGTTTSRPTPTPTQRLAVCTAATNYECGKQIGTDQQQRIQDALKTQHGAALIAFIATTHGQALFAQYTTLHQSVYPHLVEEIRGTADGAQVDFHHLLALNLEFELMAKGNLTSNGFEKGCSDYHVTNSDSSGSAGWGHNEDGNPADDNLYYFVSAKIASSSSYFSFTYAGRLSGWAWSYNTNGLVFTVNGLFVLPTTPLGLGINFVARDLLDSTTVDDAVTRANRTGQDGGSHFNVGDIHSGTQLSIETGGNAGMTVQVIDGTTGKWYAHFNQYLHNDRQPHRGDYTSSIFRMARVATLSQRRSEDLDSLTFVLDVLGDQGGSNGGEPDVYCLHRCNSDVDPYVTYVTVLIDLQRKTLAVYSNRTSAAQRNGYWWLRNLTELSLPMDLPLFPR